jgi:hypothetical protein
MGRCATIVLSGLLAAGCSLITPLDQLGGGDGGGADVTPSEGGGPDAACTDTLSDPLNCGYCGHDCRGGKCTSGVCDPTILLSGVDAPSGITVDDTNVYFTLYLAGQVAKCPLAGCGVAPTILSSGDTGSNGIRVNATTLFWANEGGGIGGGSVKRCALPSCTQKTTIGTGTLVEWVALDQNNVYWTSSYDGTAWSCALGGCSGSPTSIASGLTVPWGLAVDSTNIYLAVWNGSINAPAPNGGVIQSCPLAGCTGAPILYSNGENQPWEIAVDATYVYWTGFKDGTVKRCPIAGCSGGPTLIASDEGGPSGIALDADNVYWTNYTSGSVRMCAKEGCSTRSASIAVGQNHPNELALDSQWVYFTDIGSTTVGANDGSIVKVPK